MVICFVCTGNICRSAMAEGVSKKTNTNPTLRFISMGTHTQRDQPADPKAVKVCEELGIDISSHRATPVSLAELNTADLIFVMDRSHLSYINLIAPHVSDKTHLISDFPRKRIIKKSVKDPFGHSLAAFRKTRNELKVYISKILSHIEEK